jgi:hypothetical protein
MDRRAAFAMTLLTLAMGLAALADEPHRLRPQDVTYEYLRAAADRAQAYLANTQNPDGSWGGAADSLTTWSGETWSNPESHRAWRVATTGLCCTALLERAALPADRDAANRGLDYLVQNAAVKRPNEWDTMGCWAFIYGLQALVAAYQDGAYAADPRRDEFRRAAQTCLEQLAYHQSLSGGWGYLEFDGPRTARPQWATSFTTAAGVVALVEARHAGLDVDPALLNRAVQAVRRCRLPDGAYTYSVQALAHPRLIGSIDRVNGSLSRIQVCNLALRMAGEPIDDQRLVTGLAHFFREHRFLELALHKPVPHEAFYQNSGYFYLFGHYYAARVIECLPRAAQEQYWPKLAYEVLKIQQANGSLWDYDHHAYDRAYGTAYGLMVLRRALCDSAEDAWPESHPASGAP